MNGGQQEAVGVIADIESWWGEQLTPSLIDAIASAPFAHLAAFHEESDDLQTLYQIGHLPSLPTGSLRPICEVDPGS